MLEDLACIMWGWVPSQINLDCCRGRIRLKFEAVLQYKFGYPNDEVLQSHPLYKYGLTHYSFFTVENSPFVREIEKQNECHPRHRRGIYAEFHHWIITFHDDTLEVIALRAESQGQAKGGPEQALFRRGAN